MFVTGGLGRLLGTMVCAAGLTGGVVPVTAGMFGRFTVVGFVTPGVPVVTGRLAGTCAGVAAGGVPAATLGRGAGGSCLAACAAGWRTLWRAFAATFAGLLGFPGTRAEVGPGMRAGFKGFVFGVVGPLLLIVVLLLLMIVVLLFTTFWRNGTCAFCRQLGLPRFSSA
jgi:hypothetical protein